jgi:hypothetical protein
MNGHEHYAEAERLLAQVDDGAADWEPIVAAAQVHATLALAAATAVPSTTDAVLEPWLQVIFP